MSYNEWWRSPCLKMPSTSDIRLTIQSHAMLTSPATFSSPSFLWRWWWGHELLMVRILAVDGELLMVRRRAVDGELLMVRTRAVDGEDTSCWWWGHELLIVSCWWWGHELLMVRTRAVDGELLMVRTRAIDGEDTSCWWWAVGGELLMVSCWWWGHELLHTLTLNTGGCLASNGKGLSPRMVLIRSLTLYIYIKPMYAYISRQCTSRPNITVLVDWAHNTKLLTYCKAPFALI